MRVRVYDSDSDSYFKSEVYAIINSGWYEKRLVLVPSASGDSMKFVDYLDRSTMPAKVNINTITRPSSHEWIHRRSDSVDVQLAEFAGLIDNDVRFFEFIGGAWLFENKPLMVELLNGNAVPITGSIWEEIYDSRTPEWNYIETQDDIDRLMEFSRGFHDSVLKSINYMSGAFVDSNKSMHFGTCTQQVTMIFDSQWCKSFELVFEGVSALNLRPAGDNYLDDIYAASLHIQDAVVYFFDDHVEKIDESYEGTWAKAYSLRWRFVQ